jgi:hypothetical protein
LTLQLLLGPRFAQKCPNSFLYPAVFVFPRFLRICNTSFWKRPSILFQVFLYLLYRREELELYCWWHNCQPL